MRRNQRNRKDKRFLIRYGQSEQRLNKTPSKKKSIVELQWIEHLVDIGNLFETWVIRATGGGGGGGGGVRGGGGGTHRTRRQMGISKEGLFHLL